MHLKGLEIANSKVGASATTPIPRCKPRERATTPSNYSTSTTASGRGCSSTIPKRWRHLILNCDSHDNYDINGSQGDGQNADGFGHHTKKAAPPRPSGAADRGGIPTTATTSSFKMCRSSSRIAGPWAAATRHGTASPVDGNGNGFKMGGNVTNTRHMIHNCVAWKNKDSGFYSNHSTGDTPGTTTRPFKTARISTCCQAPARAHPAHGGTGHILRNNISFTNKTANMAEPTRNSTPGI